MSEDYSEEAIQDAIEALDDENKELEQGVDSSAQDQEDSGQTQPKAEAESQDVDPELSERAKQIGLDPDLFKGEDALRKAVADFDQRVLAAGQQSLQQAQQQYQQPEPQQYQQQQPQEEVPQLPEFKIEFPEELAIPEEVGGAIQGTIDKVAEYYNGQMEMLAQHVYELSSWAQQQQQQASYEAEQKFHTEFDGAITSLNRPSTFGKGETLSLDVNSNEALKRTQILNQVQVMAAGYQATGQQMPSLEFMVKQSDAYLNAKEIQRLESQAASKKARKQAGNRVGGVAHSGSNTKPDDPAVNPEILEFFNANSR